MSIVSRPIGSERSPCRGMKATSGLGLHGFVLVGGRSSRLGMDKASFLIEGVPAADVLASRLASVCDLGVRLVGRETVNWSSFDTLVDERPGSGPLSGVHTALRASVSGCALVVAADLWRITSQSLERIADALYSTSRNPGRLTVAEGAGDDGAAFDVSYAKPNSGLGQPLCSAWRADACLDVVESRLESHDRSLFGLLAALRSTPVEVDGGELANVNTPEDLELFLRDSDGRG